jgi:parvulin-like peptidyl-prolyl isomerase
MNKKNADREKEEDEDLEDEDDEDEDEDEDEEDEQPAAQAKAVDARRERPRAQRAAASHDHDHDHDHDHGHDDDDDDDDDEEEDAYWWTPHAVMSVLVLAGVLGFFGVFNKVLGHIIPPAVATEEKAEKADKPVAAAPKPPEQREEYGAKHLLVQYKGAMRAPPTITRTEEEAKARATEAMKKAKGGSKFEDLVRDYSDEPNAAARGGDLGKFRKGQMVPEFQNAVEKLKVGEVSDLVKTPFGYHVILRTQ